MLSGICIDLECIDRINDPLEHLAFSPPEHDLVDALDGPLRQEWALRLCAKEATGKALGTRCDHPASLAVVDLDLASGAVQVAAADPATPGTAALDVQPLTVRTVRDSNWIAAVAIL